MIQQKNRKKGKEKKKNKRKKIKTCKWIERKVYENGESSFMFPFSFSFNEISID